MPDQTDIAIIKYLSKKGYRNAEEMVKEEAISSSSAASASSSAENSSGALSTASTTIEQATFDLTAEQDSQVATSSISGGSYLMAPVKKDDTNAGQTSSLAPAPSTASSSTSTTHTTTTASLYEQQFTRMKKWILNSLDIYKYELLGLIFPVFVHCFLDLHSKGHSAEATKFLSSHRHTSSDVLIVHSDDIDRLSSIKDIVHIRENPLAIAFRSNKYNVRLSLYAFELFVTFVNENRLTLIRKIVNQHINMIVVDGTTTSSSLGTRDTSLGGSEDGLASYAGTPMAEPGKRFSQPYLPKVYWGGFRHDYDEDVWKAFKSDVMATCGKPELTSSILSQVKKMLPDASKEAPSKDRIPLPEPNKLAVLERLKELSKRVSIGKNLMPSSVCYTLHNTYDRMTCMSFSPSFDMIAGGFADSYIDLWTLRRDQDGGFRTVKKSTELAYLDFDSSPTLGDIVQEDKVSVTKRLIGHSGPVSGVAFAPDVHSMVSSSFDGTLRLWSLDLFSPLVVYKGHQGPVWDVDMSAQGLYFASAGADRTARIWSTEYVSPLRLLVGHLSDVESVSFHPNGNYMASGSADRTVRLWDIQSGSTVRLFTGGGGIGLSHSHSSSVMATKVSPDGRFLASGDASGVVCLWDLASGRLISSYGEGGHHGKSISSLSFSQEGTTLASGSINGTVCLWDTKTSHDVDNHHHDDSEHSPSLIKTFYTKNTPVLDLCFTYRNLLLAGGPYTPFSQ